MEGGFHTDLIAALVALGGLAGLSGLAIYAIRRAKAARRRQIEGAEAAPVQRPKRPALRPEDVEGEPPASDEPGTAAPSPRTLPTSRPLPAPDSVAAAPQPVAPAAPRPVPREALPQKAPAAVLPLRVPESTPPAAPPPGKLPSALLVEKPRGRERPMPARKREVAALVPGLEPTRSGWVKRLGQLFAGKKELDPTLLEEIEKVLLTADIGVRTSQKLLGELRESLDKKAIKDPAAVWGYLRRRSVEILTMDTPAVDFAAAQPFVLLVIGVNGSGKTTTIGKLASKLQSQGRKVLLAAGDTFRAAATEQLEVWGAKVGAPVVRGKEGGDPSSVVFDCVKRARAEGSDVVIADTAGRLHTKKNLMEELQKVRRVAGKAMEGAPHETWLVIDATSGQNAIAQAQEFTKDMAVTGIVLTKLDGTAKGGVILGIADQLRIPVRYIGMGERVEDLREFEAEDFVEALFGEAPAGADDVA
jgi:signal recognition particle-docking protein FtsY